VAASTICLKPLLAIRAAGSRVDGTSFLRALSLLLLALRLLSLAFRGCQAKERDAHQHYFCSKEFSQLDPPGISGVRNRHVTSKFQMLLLPRELNCLP
jgi:hypothetical protein